jgi:hypothetical protein
MLLGIQYFKASLKIATSFHLLHHPHTPAPHPPNFLPLPRRRPPNTQRQVVLRDPDPEVRLHLLDLLEVHLDHITNLMLLAADGVDLVLVELDLGFERAPGVLVGVIFLGQLGLEASNFRVWDGGAE